MTALWKQFKIGAINGFVLGFSGALISGFVLWAILFFKLHRSVAYFKDAPMMYNDYLRIFVSFTLLTGTAKVIFYFIFRKQLNVFAEWQAVGLITLLLFYLFAFVENVFDYFTIPGTFDEIFQESFDASSWLIGLVIFTIYNLAFAFILKKIKTA